MNADIERRIKENAEKLSVVNSAMTGLEGIASSRRRMDVQQMLMNSAHTRYYNQLLSVFSPSLSGVGSQ